ncbi:MAG: hypothetical protein L0H93_21805, partial [Nocardioides sp.]|nr:hypothetical protein [Nocardioides sp.]
EQVRSGPESGLRLVCEVDAGFPRLEVNCPVRDLTGRLLGIADLLDVDAGLVVEFDGAEHRGITRHNADLKKDEALRQVRMEVTRVSGTDLLNRRMVVQRLLHARARARFEPPQARLWVAEPVPDSAEQELQEREALIDSYERLREPQPRSA